MRLYAIAECLGAVAAWALYLLLRGPEDALSEATRPILRDLPLGSEIVGNGVQSRVPVGLVPEG